jgi:hypothetical protein
MALLDGSSITVDAILTQHGRSKLADGGGLDIRKFSLADDGVNYKLFNTAHPSGSTWYGQAIKDLPQLEAVTDDYSNMKYHLLTMDRHKVFLPKIVMDPDVTQTSGCELRIIRQGLAGGKRVSFKTMHWGEEEYALRLIDATGLIVAHAPNVTRNDGRRRRYHALQGLPDDISFGPVKSFEFQAEPILEAKQTACIVHGLSSGTTFAFKIFLDVNVRRLPDVTS